MKILLGKFKLLTFILLLGLCGNVRAQCSITGVSPNVTTYNPNPCSLLSSCGGVLYIGDGVNPTNLIMSTALNLTCLGSIQLIVKNNASIDFSAGNDYLTLAAGSSILFEGTGTLIGGSCNASERIYIGSDLIASCNGQGPGADYSFPELVIAGGFNIVNITPTSASACGSGSFYFTATAVPSATATSVRWYSVASGGTPLQTNSGSSSSYTSPTITSTTTYYAEATIGAFITPRKAVVATINPLPSTPTVGTRTQPTCTLATGSVILGSLPASGTWTLTRSGTSSATTTGTGTSTTISGLAVGTYAYTVSNGTCTSAVSSNVVINAQPVTPVQPTLGSVTQPTCAVATGSFTITNYNAGYTYTVSPSTGVTVSGSTITAPVGSYTLTATLGSCVSVASSSVTINALVTNTWRGIVMGWDVTTPPTADQKIVFDSTDLYTLNADITACSCQAKSDVIVKTGHTLTLTNELTVDGFANVVFEDGASLVQTNNTTNVGDIYYNRSTSARPTDYTYWSSPVTPMTLGELYPLGGTFYSYEATLISEAWKQETAATNMIAGKGYIANRGTVIPLPGPPPPPDLLGFTFAGVPNNGSYSISVFQDKSCLLGNSYPSAIDADTFLLANASVIEGTIYFWTHATQIGIGVTDPGTGFYAYSGDDYASYNTTGGVGIGNFVNGTEQTANRPNGYISAGQGFFATSIATGNVTFNNNMRVAGNNSQFFKKKNSKTEKVIEKNRLWLNLTNTQGAFKQTLIGYVTDATNEYDSRFDGESFDGNEFVDFYSVIQDKNLVIQGRALPFDENDEVLLGYRTTITGNFTINIDQVDGLLSNQAVFLEDKLTNTIFDLKSSPYTFATEKGTFNDRFVLHYKDNTLGVVNPDTQNNPQVLVSVKNKQLTVNSFVETIDKIVIYDLLGRRIFQKNNVNSNEFTLFDIVSSHQTLVIKTVLKSGKTVNYKTIIRK